MIFKWSRVLTVNSLESVMNNSIFNFFEITVNISPLNNDRAFFLSLSTWISWLGSLNFTWKWLFHFIKEFIWRFYNSGLNYHLLLELRRLRTTCRMRTAIALITTMWILTINQTILLRYSFLFFLNFFGLLFINDVYRQQPASLV